MTAPKVYEAISTVMHHMAKEGIGKDRNNEQQRYKFRGIDDIYNALSGVLAKSRLVMLPYVQDMVREERQTRNGGALNYVILTVDYTIVAAEDGSTHTIRTIGEAMDSADKASNKAMSAALKYAALQVFMIPTEGDNDADATTHEVRSGPAPRSKLEGKHASKTALKAAIQKARNEIRAAPNLDELRNVWKAYRDDIAQAEAVWPELLKGFPDIAEDIGLNGDLEQRKAALSDDRGMLNELIASMKKVENLLDLGDWLETNRPLVDALSDEQGRMFQREYEAFDAGLVAVSRTNAG